MASLIMVSPLITSDIIDILLDRYGDKKYFEIVVNENYTELRALSIDEFHARLKNYSKRYGLRIINSKKQTLFLFNESNRTLILILRK